MRTTLTLLSAAALGLVLAVGARAEDDALTALAASARQLGSAAGKAQAQAGPAMTAERIEAMSGDELMELGRKEGLFALYTLPKLNVEFGKTPDEDREWVDLTFNPIGSVERTTPVDVKLWTEYWKRAEDLFVSPTALAELKERNVSVVSYGDRASLGSQQGLGRAGSLLDPKKYAAVVEAVAAVVRTYPAGFFKRPLVVEAYAAGRMLSGEYGTAESGEVFDRADRIALLSSDSAAKTMAHEIGHIVIPAGRAEKIVESVYGGLQEGRNGIKGAQVATEEQRRSFLPNCIQSWDEPAPQGQDNAAEDLATIAESLQCGRREQVLARARENPFLRRKVEAVAAAYQERGFDASGWRP